MAAGRMGAVGAKPAAAAGGFTPTDIANCALWLDATDASSFTFSSGVLVSQWNDKSGNSRHITQGNSTFQPSRNGTINSLDAVTFVDDKLSTTDPGSPTAQPFTVFNVQTFSALSGSSNVLSGGYNSAATGPAVGATGTSALIYAGTASGTGSTLSTATTYAIVATGNGASSELRVNGGADLTATNPGTGGFQGYTVGTYVNTGTSGYFRGALGELIIYNSALSLADLDTVGNYLAGRWGFTWTAAS